MPGVKSKRDAKRVAERELVPRVGAGAELVQALGHTVLLYRPHPTAPKLARALGLGAGANAA
jgi:RNA-binding protein YhbY